MAYKRSNGWENSTVAPKSEPIFPQDRRLWLGLATLFDYPWDDAVPKATNSTSRAYGTFYGTALNRTTDNLR